MRTFCCKAPRIPLKGSVLGKALNLGSRKPWASWEVVSVLILPWFSVSASLCLCGSYFLNFFVFFFLQYSLKSGLCNWILVYVTFDTIICDANSQSNYRLWTSTHILTLWLADFESGVQNSFNHIHQMVPCPSPAAGLLNLDCLPLSILLSTHPYPWALLPITPDIFLQGHQCWCIRQFCHPWKFIVVIFHTLQVECARVKTDTFSSTTYAHYIFKNMVQSDSAEWLC